MPLTLKPFTLVKKSVSKDWFQLATGSWYTAILCMSLSGLQGYELDYTGNHHIQLPSYKGNYVIVGSIIMIMTISMIMIQPMASWTSSHTSHGGGFMIIIIIMVIKMVIIQTVHISKQSSIKAKSKQISLKGRIHRRLRKDQWKEGQRKRQSEGWFAYFPKVSKESETKYCYNRLEHCYWVLSESSIRSCLGEEVGDSMQSCWDVEQSMHSEIWIWRRQQPSTLFNW